MSRKPAHHPYHGQEIKHDPVGQLEIAERAGVKPDTVKKWRDRHPSFPKPRWTVGGNPAWEWAVVRRWLEDNGRVANHFRFRIMSSDASSVLEETRDADGNWEPTVAFVDIGGGPGNEDWRAFPKPALLQVVDGDKETAQLIADNHLRAWLDARVKWVAEHPDEDRPRHLFGH